MRTGVLPAAATPRVGHHARGKPSMAGTGGRGRGKGPPPGSRPPAGGWPRPKPYRPEAAETCPGLGRRGLCYPIAVTGPVSPGL